MSRLMTLSEQEDHKVSLVNARIAAGANGTDNVILCKQCGHTEKSPGCEKFQGNLFILDGCASCSPGRYAVDPDL